MGHPPLDPPVPTLPPVPSAPPDPTEPPDPCVPPLPIVPPMPVLPPEPPVCVSMFALSEPLHAGAATAPTATSPERTTATRFIVHSSFNARRRVMASVRK